MKFSIKHFFSKCDQIRSFLRIWSHLLNKTLIESFIFCAVKVADSCEFSKILKNVPFFVQHEWTGASYITAILLNWSYFHKLGIINPYKNNQMRGM